VSIVDHGGLFNGDPLLRPRLSAPAHRPGEGV